MTRPKRVNLGSVGSSKAKAKISRIQYDEKMEQIAAAVRYCEANNCRGKKALSTGKFPLVKDHKTITRRLDGDVVSGQEKSHVSILLAEEEECLVSYAINKARAMQPIKRNAMTDLILNTLRIRKANNKKMKGGRKCVKLSRPALNALRKGRVSKFFWQRFQAKYEKVLREKRVGHTSLARAVACTTDMAIAHLDSLAEELISKGIFTNAEQIKPGVWTGDIDGSRVFNRDETPQAIRYGVDGSANNLAFCGSGENCNELIKENREFVTIEPFISLDGKVHMCHVIFAAAGITSAMAPSKAVESIKNLLISTTESGYQTGESCLGSCKYLDKILAKEGILRPISMLTDGHSSRFDLSVLRFNKEKQMTSHVSPADTTSVTQVLDQLNAALHSRYDVECAKFFRDNHINREVFMEVLSEVWKTWTTSASIIKAWKRCGISSTGLSYEWMQQDKLEAADALVQKEHPATPKQQKESWDIESPVGVRKGTLEYERRKNEMYREALKERSQNIVSPDEVPGFLTIEKVRVPPKKKAIRLTQVHGSMEGSKILELREEVEKKQQEKEAEKLKKKMGKSEQKNSFLRCKDSCVCGSEKCQASGLKQCPVCGDVMKTHCSKKKCQVNGIKPLMVFCGFDQAKKAKAKANVKAPKVSKKRGAELFADDSDDSDYSNGSDDLDDFDDFPHQFTDDDDEESTVGGVPRAPSQNGRVLLPIKNEDVVCGMWVVVSYEGECFIGMVVSKDGEWINVRCLQLPYGIGEPQLFEEGEGESYPIVFESSVTPEQVSIDGQLFWKY